MPMTWSGLRGSTMPMTRGCRSGGSARSTSARTPLRECHRSPPSDRKFGDGIPMTSLAKVPCTIVTGVVAVVDGAAVAAGRFADDPDAVSRQRAQDTALEHDNPIEEVYEDQLLCADLVVLNKADLMSAEQRREVAGEIGRVVSGSVKIVEVENGRVSPTVLLGLGVAAEDDIANRFSHHDAETEHDHDDFESFVINLRRFEAPQTLVEKIAEAAAKHDILRVKGFVEISGKPMRLLIQGVGSRIQHRFDRAWQKDENRRSRLVVIGQKGLDTAAIRNLIQD